MACIQFLEKMGSGHKRSSFVCVDGSHDESRFTRKRSCDPDCPNEAQHTPEPPGYLDWHSWAARMGRSHRQTRCGGCGLLAIWVPKVRRGPRGPYVPRKNKAAA